MISRAVMPTRRSRTWVFLWIALFLMGILLQYGVALSRPGTALAASSLKAQTVQNFEVDGDLKGSNASVDAATCSARPERPRLYPRHGDRRRRADDRRRRLAERRRHHGRQ